MPTFRYIAKEAGGRTITGTIESAEIPAVVESLRKRNLFVLSVNEERPKHAGFSRGRKKVKSDDMVIFSRQLATLVDAGIPLVQGLDILCEQMENKTMRDTIAKVRDDIETGSSLSEALSRHPRLFSNLFVNMVRAGESSGMLDDILERLAVYMEKTSALQRKIKSALIYPAVVSGLAVSITLVLLLKVIPVFKEIYSGFGAKLPVPTMILIGLSDIMKRYFILVAILIGVLIFLLRRYARTENGKLRVDKTLLNLPVFGSLFRKVAISKFSRTLSTLVKSGVSILVALEIVGKTAGNKLIENAVEEVRLSVREGENIATPLAKCGVFPPMVVRLISVGEQTGELEKMLSKISDFYDEQVDAAVAGLTSLIEPLIIAFLGIVIGAIVIAMFMPIFKISEVINM